MPALRHSRRAALFGLGIALFAVAVCRFEQTRAVPLERALSPAYWVRHWRGLDRYEPQSALLESGDTARNEVCLTFDDGPDPRYGPALARLLKEKGVPATFFLVGTRVKQHPEIARLLAHDGFELGNHTYDHQRLDALKPHEIANELRLCDKQIFQATGQRTNLMRPPGVQYNDKVLHVAKALGYVTVSWTVGARDYEAQPTEFIVGRILARTRPGAIILLHQDTPETLAALPQIIDGLRAKGYRFVTVSQMLEQLHAVRPAALTKAARRR